MKSMGKNIGDPQVKDAADQFYTASELLGSLPPGSEVLIPSVITSVLAIELYLKSLIALPKSENVHTYGPNEGSRIVRAEVRQKTHRLTALFDAIDKPIRDHINTCYSGSILATHCGAGSFRDCLAKYNETFEKVRYIFEHGRYLPDDVDEPRRIASFMKEIVEGRC